MDIECICPPKADGQTRHDHDTIKLRERLDFRAALAARNAFVLLQQEDPGSQIADYLAVLSEYYLLNGIESWTVVSSDGKRVEPTKPAIREYLLSRPDIAIGVADEADALYSEAVMRPLVAMARTTSATTPTKRSTSATNGSQGAHPRPSKRSSTSTTPTGATATTSSSPAGASS